MKPYARMSCLIVGIVTLFLSVSPAAQEATGKIPITSSSQKAIDLYITGLSLAENLRNREADSYFERAVQEDPKFALAWYAWSVTADNNREFRERINRAMSLAGHASEGERLLILATDAAAAVEPMKQRRYLRQLVTAYPNDERAHQQLATHYYGQQDLALAIESYKRAVEINPEYATPYNQLGYSYRQLGNYEKAEEAFKRYINLIPDDPNPYDSYAELLLATGKFDKSIEMYQKALSINPGFAASYLGIASNYVMMGRYDDARDKLQNLFGPQNSYGERRAGYAGLLLIDIYEGDMDAALKKVDERFDEAARLPDVAGMAADKVLAANILYEMGKFDESIESSRASVELIKGSDLPDEAIYNAERNFLAAEALYYVKVGDIKTAKSKADEYEELVDKARIPAGMRVAQQIHGVIALETEKFDEAIERLKVSNQQNPYNLFRLGQAYEGAGDRDDAKDMYRRVVDFNPLLNLGHACVLSRAKQKLESF